MSHETPDAIERAFRAGYHCQWIRNEGRYIFDPNLKPGDPDGAFKAWMATEAASPPAADTGRDALIKEALRLLIEATRYNRADRIYELNPETYRAIEDNLRRARVSGQPVGEGPK